LIVGAQAFASTEHDSIGQGLYWAIGTMTTAGSGDVMANRSETEAVGSVLMIVGLVFGAIITGAIAQRFIVTEHTVTQGNIETLAKQDATHAKLDAIAQRLDRLELALTTAAPPSKDSDTAAE
jgi:voltage-gated potassium channel